MVCLFVLIILAVAGYLWHMSAAFSLLKLKCLEMGKENVSLKIQAETVRKRYEELAYNAEVLKREKEELTKQVYKLEKQNQRNSRQVTHQEQSSLGSAFKTAVTALVGLGVPGLILLSVVATTGFAGAASITAALALLGGPFGMLGGISALTAMGLGAKAFADRGFGPLADAVIKGLMEKGETKEGIRRMMDNIPARLIPAEAKAKLITSLNAAL